MPKLMHCGAWHCATESYVLLPPRAYRHYKHVVLQLLKCPQCRKELYQWYGVTSSAKLSKVTAISAKEFYDCWAPMIEAGLVLKPQAALANTRLFVSEYSRKIASSKGVGTGYHSQQRLF